MEKNLFSIFVKFILILIPYFEFTSAQTQLPQQVYSEKGIVASSSSIASEIGINILKSGGNAIDAAIAVGFALCVTYPSAGNIGGGGFMIIRKNTGEVCVIDYREAAPKSATRNMYLDEKGEIIPEASTTGYRATAVPGTVAGFELAYKKFGKLKWKKLIEPAIKLARDGFEVSRSLARQLSDSSNPIFKFPESKKIFHKQNNFYKEGDIFKQPDLAKTLKRIQKHGAKDFYSGKTAKLIVEDMRVNNGLITFEDLKLYKPVIRKPVIGTYRNYTIISMPPPSSGGAVLIEMLNILENYDLKNLGHDSPQKYHLLIEAMRRAYADRSKYFGDPDFVKIPIKGLTSKSYARELSNSIDTNRASSSESITTIAPQSYESEETTHFTIIDTEGNIVVNTYTLNGSYGNGAVVKGAGFLLNNEMDDFTTKPGKPNLYGLIQGEANAIEPYKRPLSSMTPTIVLKDEKPFLALGSPGGPTIINTVLQVIINVVDHEMNLQQALNAPRIHHQWLPDIVFYEESGISKDVIELLVSKGHKLELYSKKFPYIGDVQAIMVDPVTGIKYGASDFRSPDAKAISY